MDEHLPLPASESASNFVTEYFQRLRMILLEPTRFYRQMPLEGGLSAPLAFALVTHWIAAGLEFFVNHVLGFGFSSIWQKALQWDWEGGNGIDNPGRGQAIAQMKALAAEWISSSAIVLTTPFWTLLWMTVAAFFVWLGSRLLAKQPADTPRGRYQSSLRLIAYGTAPVLLVAVPYVGWLAADLYTFIICVIGAREIYQVTAGRASVIVLFPRILLWGLIVLIPLLFLAGLAGLIFSFMR